MKMEEFKNMMTPESLQPSWKSECMNTKVDMVEVVRCKKCKYWNNGYLKYDVHPWLPCMEMPTDKNWYCAEGKPKET